MTDNLKGLNAELRKAVRTSLQVSNEEFFFCREHTAEEGDEYREKTKWLPADLVAKEMVSIIAALKAIKNNDKTTAYTYSSGSKNREGKAPKRGQRWATPYEIAQEELQRLEKV